MSWFVDNLGAHGDNVALLTTDGAITYRELEAQVNALRDELGPTRRLVLVSAANAVKPVVAYLAALRGGHAVLLAAGDADNVDELSRVYDPDVVITAGSDWSVVARRPGSAHSLHPDLALLMSTSGSTGSPKLVRLSRQNLEANASAIVGYLGLTGDDRAMTTLPMQYCYGLSVLNSHLHAGAAVVLTHLSVVDRCFWDLFRRVGATSMAGVPHTFDLLDRAGFEAMELPTLRYVTQAGGRMHPDKVRRYAQLAERDGWQLFVMYGQTEATARMAYLPPALAASHPGAIGVAVPGGTLGIDAPDGSGVGELVYRGPNVMLGYAEHPRDLANGPTVGALRTGDLARLTDAGVYEVVGRASRFLKLYGQRVDLDRVEMLLSDQGITSMCTGTDAELLVAVTGAANPEAIHSLVCERLTLPRAAVRVMPFRALPRLATGKPDYCGIRDRAASRPDRTGGRDGTVRATFHEILGVAPADGDSFVSLGGDSLSYVEMSIRLEEVLGHLPRDWHVLPVSALVPTPARRRGARTETSVVLRAAAIALVVGTHAKLWHLPGGAHALLAIGGYNFARFQLRSGSMLPSIARVAVPSMCWIGAVAAVSDKYAWPHALLLNGPVLGHSRSGYWYIEATVQILLVLALCLRLPVVRRAQEREPFAFALGAVAVGLVLRFDPLALFGADKVISRPQDVAWLFALGWATGQASTPRRRVAVSTLAALTIPGFFGDPSRDAIVLAGVLLVVWLPTLVLPRASARLVGTVAGASLYIYLTHWQIFPVLGRSLGPVAATFGSVAAGVLVWMLARPVSCWFESACRSVVRRLRPPAVRPAQVAEPCAVAGERAYL